MNIIYNATADCLPASNDTPGCLDVDYELRFEIEQSDSSYSVEYLYGKVTIRSKEQDHDFADPAYWLSVGASKDLAEFCSKHDCASLRGRLLRAIRDASRLALEIHTLKVETSNARTTTSAVRGGVDIDWEFSLGGIPFSGQATMAPLKNGQFGRWGLRLSRWLSSRDYFGVHGSMVADLNLSYDRQIPIINAIEAACAKAATLGKFQLLTLSKRPELRRSGCS